MTNVIKNYAYLYLPSGKYSYYHYFDEMLLCFDRRDNNTIDKQYTHIANSSNSHYMHTGHTAQYLHRPFASRESFFFFFLLIHKYFACFLLLTSYKVLRCLSAVRKLYAVKHLLQHMKAWLFYSTDFSVICFNKYGIRT